MNVHLSPKLLIKKEKIRIFWGPILWLFKIGLILSIWLYSKQQKLLIQHLFLKYFKVKAVQNRPQNVRKVRQFNICINNCCMTIQNRVNFADFVRNSKQRKLQNQNLFHEATHKL